MRWRQLVLAAGRGGAGWGGAHLGEHAHELEGVDEALALRGELDLANVGAASEDGEARLRGVWRGGSGLGWAGG